MQKCNCNNCEVCKLNIWIIEAKKLKQDMLNGVKSGKPMTQGEVNAYIAASFTVLEMLDKKAA